MCLLPAADTEAADLTMTDKERRIGHLFDHFMTESFVMLKDERTSEKISEVVDRIVKATEHPDAEFILRIINDHVPLVSSFPGYIYVSSGMLDIIESEDHLATLIAHSLAHVHKNVQHRAYIDSVQRDQKARLTGYIIPVLFFSGAGAAAIGGELASASEGLFLLGTGIFAVATFNGAVTSADSYENRHRHNKLVPHLYLPDTATGMITQVFLNDVYGGYGKHDEVQADRLALQYLQKAGYDTRSQASVARKLMKAANDFIGKGYTSHLFTTLRE